MKKKRYPLMPKATAVWLIDNTTLTFRQIAEFCGLHELEIKGIADGEVAKGIRGVSPIDNNQLTSKEIERCSADENANLSITVSEVYESVNKPSQKRAKYTPIARRQDKPDAIYWFIKNFPEIKDNKIIKIVGTTKTTVESIRDRSYWNMQNIKPRDPVLLGICSQRELDKLIEVERLEAKTGAEFTDTTLDTNLDK